MKLEHNCNYFIRMNIFRFFFDLKFIFYLALLVLFSSIFSNCGSDRKRQNNLKKEECLRFSYLSFVQSNSSQSFTSAENEILKYELSYTCSADSGQSPSCIEYYFQDAKGKNVSSICNSGYRKTSAICSEQNPIGTCIVFFVDGYVKTSYNQPNDDPQRSELDCNAKKGYYQSQESKDLLTKLLLNCELIQQDN